VAEVAEVTTVVSGLSSVEAAARLARDGGNVLPVQRSGSPWRRVGVQLRDPLVAVLLVAAALTVATGDWTDAAVIALVIIVNTSVGAAQEVKADRAITALATLAAPEARVLRDGVQRVIPAADVVVGDLLVLAEGDIVPADARVVEAAALLVDEAALTGESVPVDKSAELDVEHPGDVVSAGTVVVRGRGRAVVTATGSASAMGRIAALMVTGSGLTPLQRRLVGVGRALAAVAVVLCAVVLALGLARGEPLELMVITAISLVVAAVPESLPTVVTLALALGARRMAARNALIRRLPAVETLGSVTVIATDKTGTLTEGRMVVREVWTPTGTALFDGVGYGPHGRVVRDGQPVSADTAPDVAEVLADAALCNDAVLGPPDDGTGDWTALGDPTEGALLAAAGKLGLDPIDLVARYPRVAEQPFDSDRKRMSTAHRRPGGGLRVICKGAPEVLLNPDLLADPPQLLARAAERAEALARNGYRVLAVARTDREPVDAVAPAAGMAPPVGAAPVVPASGVEFDGGLRLLGLVAILDPARPSAAATVAACRAAGITPVLITGDHPATARAIAVETGIIDPDG
jgi:Ca2+-transporting ATPase